MIKPITRTQGPNEPNYLALRSVPDKPETAQRPSPKVITRSPRAPRRSFTILSSNDSASTPSASSIPGASIAAAKRLRPAMAASHDGHAADALEQALQNTCPHGDSRWVASSRTQCPHRVCTTSSLPPAAARSLSSYAMDLTSPSGVAADALFAAGMCSSYSSNQGRSYFR